MSFPTPCVVKRHGGRTAIILRLGRTRYDLIELEPGQLYLRQRTEGQLAEDGYSLMAYAPDKAAKKFLEHSGGLTANARQALEGLIDEAFLL